MLPFHPNLNYKENVFHAKSKSEIMGGFIGNLYYHYVVTVQNGFKETTLKETLAGRSTDFIIIYRTKSS